MKTTTQTLTREVPKKLKLTKVTISKLSALPVLGDGSPGQSTNPICDLGQTQMITLAF